MSEMKLSRTTSGVVRGTPGRYTGYVVTTALSAAAVTIYDHASAASGVAIDVIPASSAAGTKGSFVKSIRCELGIYASFGGTGTVTFLYD